MARQRVIRCMDEADALIRKRKPFRTAARKTPYAGTLVSMNGAPISDSGLYWLDEERTRLSGFGQLPLAYHRSLAQATYVVFSYDTPIAWYLPIPAEMTAENVEQFLTGDDAGHWVMPEVRYSVTTTQHQTNVRCALAAYDRPWRSHNEPDATPQIVTHLKIEGAPEKVPSGCERTMW